MSDTGSFRKISLPSAEGTVHEIHDDLCEGLRIVEENDIDELATTSQLRGISEQSGILLEQLKKLIKP